MTAKGGRVKVTLVGHSAIGKTALVTAAVDRVEDVKDSYIHETIRVVDFTIRDVKRGEPVKIMLWDTSGVYENNIFEILKYPNADVIIIAYAVDSPDSFDGIQEKWLEEVKHFCPEAPIILVGLRKDTRDSDALAASDHRNHYISYKDGDTLAGCIGAVAFLECSSTAGDGVDELIEILAGTASSDQVTICKKRRSQKTFTGRIRRFKSFIFCR